MLDNLGIDALDPASDAWAHRFAEASNLAFADRNTYIADPDFVPLPIPEMVAPSYLKQRAKQITKTAMPVAQPGRPSPDTSAYQMAPSPELPSTSHFSIIDATGNGVSMTTSIETAFGSRIMVGGFLLNNQLTDFSFQPADNGENIANRIQAGKRPRSSMSPTIVFEGKRPVLLLGSPGGSRIIDYTARVLAQRLFNGIDLADAIAGHHIIAMNKGILELETGVQPALKKALQARGHKIKERDQTSGLHGIWIDKNRLYGVADPRREGIARGK